ASDTGVSNADDVTSSVSLVLGGTAEPGSTVTVYRGSIVVAKAAAADPGGTWSVTDTAPGDGGYSYTVTATDHARNGWDVSPHLLVSVDTVPPLLNVSGVPTGYGYTLPDLPPRPAFAPTDSGSGITAQSETWLKPDTSSGAGIYVYTATATDRAGNTSTA